jgi:hypothetical protein
MDLNDRSYQFLASAVVVAFIIIMSRSHAAIGATLHY